MKLFRGFIVFIFVFNSTFALAGESTNPFGKFFGDLKENVEKSMGNMGNVMKKPDSKNKDLEAENISPISNLDVDILGIKLGMTASEAESVVKKHNSKMKITKRFTSLKEVPDTDFLSNLLAQFSPLSVETATDVILISFLRPPDSPVVGRIQRTLTFKMSEAPTLENTKASLFEKYGKPFDGPRIRMNHFQWGFYENGEPINNLKDSNACKILAKGLKTTEILDMVDLKNDRLMLHDRNQNKKNMKCGLSIGVRIRAASGLAFWISIELLDHRILFQETKNTQELVQSYREQKKNTKLKAAEKRGKPKF